MGMAKLAWLLAHENGFGEISLDPSTCVNFAYPWILALREGWGHFLAIQS